MADFRQSLGPWAAQEASPWPRRWSDSEFGIRRERRVSINQDVTYRYFDYNKGHGFARASETIFGSEFHHMHESD